MARARMRAYCGENLSDACGPRALERRRQSLKAAGLRTQARKLDIAFAGQPHECRRQAPHAAPRAPARALRGKAAPATATTPWFDFH